MDKAGGNTGHVEAAGDSESRIRFLEQRLQALSDNVVDALIVIDEAGLILSFNPAAERMFGYALGEVLGKTISILMPEPEQSAHPTHIQDYLRTGKARIIGVASRELVGRRKDGTVFSMELSVGEMPSRTGRQFVGTVRDITERKRRDDALRESEERFRLVTDALPVLIAYVNRDERYVFCNETYADWFEIPREQIVGQQTQDILGDAVYEIRKGNMQSALSGEASNVESKLPFRYGCARYVHSTYVPHTGEDGEVLGYFVLDADFTGRREAEQRLRQAYKLEAIGQLTGGVAHDFNNLLGLLTMDLDELRDATGAEREELVTEALGAVKSASELTQHLLAFSRQQPLNPKPIDATMFLQRTVALLRRTLGEHVEIDLTVPNDLYATRVDPTQLENSLLNLAINARDAMPSGGKLAIEAENASFRDSGAAPLPELAAGDYVRVRVADTGTGIPRENIDKVIEPFFTTKGPGAGTGLGLSMVYGFVKQSNGDLAIDSEVGRGTTIDLYFPRATDEVHEPLPVVEHNRRGVETVLLVEDFDRFRERAAALLTELGYKVIAAGNGDEALSILNDGTAVDLLLTDLVMPGGLGGRQLAAAARDLRSDIKILFMSGYEDRTTNSNGGAGDSVPQLRKPFSKGDLADAIRVALDGDG